jgi:hypothetical protein
MMSLDVYTEQQSRFERAFSTSASCCVAHCMACGRTYFVTSTGHGDYMDGELETLRERAKENPDKWIEVPDFSSVSMFTLDGKEAVIGCACDPTRRLSEWIEGHARELTCYLRDYWRAEHDRAEGRLKESRQSQIDLFPKDGKSDWSLMDSAPRNAQWIEILQADGVNTCVAHWASDLSGEEQPPFEGWFRDQGTANGKQFAQIVPDPIAWRPLS